MSFKKILLALGKVILLFISFTIGAILAKQYATSHFYERYEKQITLATNAVFDNDYTKTYFDGPVVLERGMEGSIVDWINGSGDDAGEDFIHASFIIDDGKVFDVLICTEANSQNKYPNVIEIEQIESYQTILSEYRHTRENYKKKVRNTEVLGGIIGLAVSLPIIIVSICFLKRRKSQIA